MTSDSFGFTLVLFVGSLALVGLVCGLRGVSRATVGVAIAAVVVVGGALLMFDWWAVGGIDDLACSAVRDGAARSTHRWTLVAMAGWALVTTAAVAGTHDDA